LTALRDKLKAGLSQATPEPGCEAMPVTEMAERIKALKADHTSEAAPERTATRRAAAEMPVTACIRRRSHPAQAIEPGDRQPTTLPVEPIKAEAVTPKPSAEPPPAEIHGVRQSSKMTSGFLADSIGGQTL
jgi:hypothetical protein